MKNLPPPRTEFSTPEVIVWNLCENTDLIVLISKSGPVHTFTQAWAVGKKQTIFHCHLCQKQTFNRDKAANHATMEMYLLYAKDVQARVPVKLEALRSIQKHLDKLGVSPEVLLAEFGIASEAPSKNE